MKELTKKQKNEALEYMISYLKDGKGDFICVAYQTWFQDNVSASLIEYEYMKTFPELLKVISRQLKKQGKAIQYCKDKTIKRISPLYSGATKRYRINLLKQVQKEVNK